MRPHEYTARVLWRRGEARFVDQRYSRAHVWQFDGGIEVPASSSPLTVRPPFSDESAVDPEEAFVASLSSCHMLFFLYHAARRGFVIDEYDDDAVGFMGKTPENRSAVLRVVLRPLVTWSGDSLPTSVDIDELHHRAHDDCFIANSVKSEVVVEPRGG